MIGKRDCSVIAHSGYGKSLIYQFPPVFLNKIALIISPLMSLINDQVFALQEKNIKACILNHLDFTEDVSSFNIVYVTPEHFGTAGCKLRLQEIKDKLCLVAVDEAHCIARYGSDYFESYKSVEQLKDYFLETPVVALTSTALPNVQSYIVDLLLMVDPFMLTTQLDRPNLRYTREIMTHPLPDVCNYMINLNGGSAIIYCLDFPGCNQIASMLTSQDFECRIYCKEMDEEDNKQTIKDFRNNKLKM